MPLVPIHIIFILPSIWSRKHNQTHGRWIASLIAKLEVNKKWNYFVGMKLLITLFVLRFRNSVFVSLTKQSSRQYVPQISQVYSCWSRIDKVCSFYQLFGPIEQKMKNTLMFITVQFFICEKGTSGVTPRATETFQYVRGAYGSMRGMWRQINHIFGWFLRRFFLELWKDQF